MRLLLLTLAATTAAQSSPQIQLSHTTESLRGVSAVSRQVAWASGTHGTYLRTVDAGRTWTPAQVPDAASLDFRAVVAFSADEAFLMSAGPGEQSRIYHTSDAGQHWQLQFTNSNPKGFFDSMAFWDSKHGVVLGDPIADETGKLKFELLLTDDGQTWHPIPPAQLPPALEGEGAFAASNTCIAILHPPAIVQSKNSKTANPQQLTAPPVILSAAVAPAKPEQLRSRRTPTLLTFLSFRQGGLSTQPSRTVFSNNAGPDANSASTADPNIWFATGGKTARVFHSPDRGQTWQVFDTPILHGPDSAGIFSIAFRSALNGVIAGGDYKHPNDDGPNLAFTHDGGKTWDLSTIHPQAYFSAVAYDRRVDEEARHARRTAMKAELKGQRTLSITDFPQRLFLVGDDFIFDFRPPANPRRISAANKLHIRFNAISPFPEGGALAVGPNGVIAVVP